MRKKGRKKERKKKERKKERKRESEKERKKERKKEKKRKRNYLIIPNFQYKCQWYKAMPKTVSIPRQEEWTVFPFSYNFLKLTQKKKKKKLLNWSHPSPSLYTQSTAVEELREYLPHRKQEKKWKNKYPFDAEKEKSYCLWFTRSFYRYVHSLSPLPPPPPSQLHSAPPSVGGIGVPLTRVSSGTYLGQILTSLSYSSHVFVTLCIVKTRTSSWCSKSQGLEKFVHVTKIVSLVQ